MKKLVGGIAAVAAVAVVFSAATGNSKKVETNVNNTSSETVTVESTQQSSLIQSTLYEQTAYSEQTTRRETTVYYKSTEQTEKTASENPVYSYNNTQSYTRSNTSPATSATKRVADEDPAETPVACDYVLNTNTGKFHYPYCNSVKQMKEKNKEYYNGSRSEVIAMGYVPCKNCNP